MKMSLFVAVCVILGATALAQDKQAKQQSVWRVSKNKGETVYTYSVCSVTVSSDNKQLYIYAHETEDDGRREASQTVTIRWEKDGPRIKNTKSLYLDRIELYGAGYPVFYNRCAKEANLLPPEVRKLFTDQWGIH